MGRLILATMVAMSATFVHADVPTKEVYINISDVFVPDGIKAGEKVSVIVNGMFPNSCYRWNRAEVKDTTTPNQLLIRTVATVTQTMCLMVLVPFSKQIDIAPLPAGEHTLRFLNGDDTYFERTLTIL